MIIEYTYKYISYKNPFINANDMKFKTVLE